MPCLSPGMLPKYRKHRATGQAIVTLAGRDHYLGPHGTVASKLEYIEKFDFVLFAGLPALRSKHIERPYFASERARKFLLLECTAHVAEYDAYLVGCYFGFAELRIGHDSSTAKALNAHVDQIRGELLEHGNSALEQVCVGRILVVPSKQRWSACGR